MARLNLAAAAAALSCTIIPALAQGTNSIATVHIPNADPQTILASVVYANPTITSYLLTCLTAGTAGYDDTDCGLGTGIHMAEGPSTFVYHIESQEVLGDW